MKSYSENKSLFYSLQIMALAFLSACGSLQNQNYAHNYERVLASNTSKVVIVGGGIGGLTALHELKKLGANVTLYERNARIGGRIWSINNIYQTNLVTNAGAELVDSTHTELLNLMDEFGVEKLERKIPEGYRSGSYLTDGEILSEAEVHNKIFEANQNALMRFEQDGLRLRASQKKGIIPEGALRTAVEQEIDTMSIADYLKKIQVDPFLFNWVKAAIGSENGRAIEEQSAIVLFDYLEVNMSKKQLQFLPGNDELYRIKGGSGQMTKAIHERYKDSIEVEKQLMSIESKDNKKFRLTFKGANGLEIVETDQLVMAVPFNQLKDVELNIPNLPSNYIRAINETTYGKHNKLVFYFNECVWNQQKHYGTAISDTGFQLWDSSEGQPGTKGSLTAYIGGDLGDEKTEVLEKRILAEIEKLFPGVSDGFIGSEKFEWKASYSGPFRPGEYSHIKLELEPIGNLRFVGEALSQKHRGYMNGAVETAGLVAHEIAFKINLPQRESCLTLFHEFIQ